MTQMLVHKNFLLRNVADSFKLELAFQLRNPFAKKACTDRTGELEHTFLEIP